MSVGVDVVNGATVDSDRGEETSVGGSTGEISADISVFEKDRAARVPALDPANPRDFFLFVSNDNDFITQNGFQVGAGYKDDSGANVDTMILVFRVTLPDLLR